VDFDFTAAVSRISEDVEHQARLPAENLEIGAPSCKPVPWTFL